MILPNGKHVSIASLTVDLVALISQVKAKSVFMSMVLAVIYVGAIVPILGIIWWALGARRPERRAVPHIDGIFGFQPLVTIDVKRKWLSDLNSAYKSDIAEGNRRVTDVYTAQECLVLAVILLVSVAALSVLIITFG